MEKSYVIYQLRHSLEMHTIKRDFLIYLALFGFMCLLAIPGGDRTGGATLMLLFLIPVLLFYIWRTVCIFRRPEDYLFYQCELTQPHFRYRGAYYFTVSFLLPDGETEILDTHAIFGGGGIIDPIIEDYVNKTAWIAYNPSTGMVVVIG